VAAIITPSEVRTVLGSLRDKTIALKPAANSINIVDLALPATGPVSEVVKGYDELSSIARSTSLELNKTEGLLRPGDRDLVDGLSDYTLVHPTPH
jgi:hypothetical protein